VVQAAGLDGLAFVGVVELLAVQRQERVIARAASFTQEGFGFLAFPADLRDVMNFMARQLVFQRLHHLDRSVLVHENAHQAAREGRP
jgi:hypothetical protein